jgi:CMP/dCMP kinase
MIITIDGPAGTGKTTVARKLAEKLGYLYFDTGAMYRALTYVILKEKVSLTDKIQLTNILENFHFTIRAVKKENRYFVEEEDVTDIIRSSDVTKNVSSVASLNVVREQLVKIQRHFGKLSNAVFEGRDMGTVVFPEAEIKVFLDARAAVRAERRYLEIKDKIAGSTQEEIMKEILERDHFDSTREISPLRQAQDAHFIDTSDLTIEEVVEKIFALIPPKKDIKKR